MRTLRRRYGRTVAKKMSADKALADVIISHYGADPLTCDSNTVEWAVHRLHDRYSAYDIAQAWKRLNARRNKRGKHTTIPTHGSPLFAPYFAKS